MAPFRHAVGRPSHMFPVPAGTNHYLDPSENQRTMKAIPFNEPYLSGKELSYIAEAHAKSQLAGGGSFTKRRQGWLERRTGCQKALLTHSCTWALEMAAILADIRPGDEVIMPSYTSVSTANAFVLAGRGARVRRHPARYAQSGRDRDRGCDHPAHARYCAGALWRCSL